MTDELKVGDEIWYFRYYASPGDETNVLYVNELYLVSEIITEMGIGDTLKTETTGI